MLDGSILSTVKKKLGLVEGYTEFDLDVITDINSVFSTLHQLGVGPEDGFEIEDATTQWSDFLGANPRYNSVRTYIVLKVRLSFDPPATSFAIDALKDQIAEHEWRLNVLREGYAWIPSPPIIDGGTSVIEE